MTFAARPLFAAPPTGGRSSLKFLFNFEGADGSTTFLDESPSPATNYPDGAFITSSRAKFGTSSMRCSAPGSVARRLPIGGAADSRFELGTQDFALEAWLFDEGGPGHRRNAIGNSGPSGVGGSLWFGFINKSSVISRVTASGVDYFCGGPTAPLGDWYQLGLYRKNGRLVQRINGTTTDSVAIPASASIPAGAGGLAIGSTGAYKIVGGDYGTVWLGCIDSCRLLVGGDDIPAEDFPVYTSPFAP